MARAPKRHVFNTPIGFYEGEKGIEESKSTACGGVQGEDLAGPDAVDTVSTHPIIHATPPRRRLRQQQLTESSSLHCRSTSAAIPSAERTPGSHGRWVQCSSSLDRLARSAGPRPPTTWIRSYQELSFNMAVICALLLLPGVLFGGVTSCAAPATPPWRALSLRALDRCFSAITVLWHRQHHCAAIDRDRLGRRSQAAAGD